MPRTTRRGDPRAVSAAKKTGVPSGPPSPGAWFLALCASFPSHPGEGDTDPECDADPRGVMVRRVQRAIAALVRGGPPDERERFQRMEERIGDGQPLRAVDEVFLWQRSFFLWGRYLEEGEPVLFTRLPHLLADDGSFFLRQWWIAEVLAAWLFHGNKKQLLRAMFGSPKKGRPVYPSDVGRNWVVVDRMIALSREGMRFEEAVEQTHKEIGTGALGISRNGMSEKNIARIYREFTEKYQLWSQWKEDKKPPRGAQRGQRQGKGTVRSGNNDP